MEHMPNIREILASCSVQSTQAILSANPRRFREEMFRKLGIKAKSGGTGFRLASKGDARASKFLEMLQGEQEIPDEVLAEVVRNYLFQRREMLADALDHLEVSHNDGLTDQELDFVAELETERLAELQEHLRSKGHSTDDISLYLAFLGAPL